MPAAYRFQRTRMLMEGSDFARDLHVTDMATHVGFMPENPHDAQYFGVLAAVREVVKKCKKNGLYPTDSHDLGRDVPLGEGKVNYPALIARLREVDYQGDITIEREITSEQQKKDILKAIRTLERMLAE